jgi:uncharacterized protein YjbI with pentapeptide repeats
VEPINLPAPPRSADEVRFFADEAPCERCGLVGLTRAWPGYDEGRYKAKCAHCGLDREFHFSPIDQHAPPFHLGTGEAPSQIFDAGRFRAIADRELAGVAPEPTEIATLDAYNEARRHMVRTRIALTELAKFLPEDAGLARELAGAIALWERYAQAQAVVEAKPGALPKPTGLSGRLKQHWDWLKRGRRGDGQMVFRGEAWDGIRIPTNRLDAAILEDSRFERIDFSFTSFHEAILTRTRFLDCRLGHTEFERMRFDHCDLTGSSLGLAHLFDVEVDGGDWQRIRAGRSRWRARVTGADLREAGLRDSVLDGSVFERCDLRGADLSREEPYLSALGTARGTRFVDCDLRGLRVESWRLDGTVFERCRMHGLVGRPILEGGVGLIGADLSAEGDGSEGGGEKLLAFWRTGIDPRTGAVVVREGAWGSPVVEAALWCYEGPLLAAWDELGGTATLLVCTTAAGRVEILARCRMPVAERPAAEKELRRRGHRIGATDGPSEFFWSSDGGFTVWSFTARLADGTRDELRLAGGRELPTAEIARVVSFLDEGSLGHRGVQVELKDGSEAVIAEEDEPAARIDPTYGMDNVMIDGAWAHFLGRDLAAWLGVPHRDEMP